MATPLINSGDALLVLAFLSAADRWFPSAADRRFV